MTNYAMLLLCYCSLLLYTKLQVTDTSTVQFSNRYIQSIQSLNTFYVINDLRMAQSAKALVHAQTFPNHISFNLKNILFGKMMHG